MFFKSFESIKQIVIMAIFFYFFIIIILKISGKRTLADLNIFDFVFTITMGPIAGATILSENTTFADGFAAIVTLASLQYIVIKLDYKYKFIGDILEADPTLLYYKDIFFKKNMKQMRITKDDILQQVRAQSGTVMENVSAVILESNGEMSIISDVNAENLEQLEEYK